MVTVFLKKNEEKRIAAGHPWVYANEVARVEGKDKNGCLAEVRDSNGRFLGRGFLNHFSKILVRILSRRDEEIDRTFFLNRLKEAGLRRTRIGWFDADNDSGRLVFAEADGLPALIVDRYADVLSVQFLSLGMDRRKEEIADCLEELFSPRGIYERSDVAVREKEGLPQTKGWLRPPADPNPVVLIRENGLCLRVDLENGQKTGYFLDQRENRFAVRRYAKNAEVLDCFSNVGGFSLNAAAAGAKSSLAVDVSGTALEEVRKNAALNGLSDRVSTLCGDVFEVLRAFRREGRAFDLVVLDPPAFTKTADEVKDALRGYRDINQLGLRLVRPGGFLVTSSCSHYVTPPLFLRMLAEAARDSGRTVRAVESRTQAPDHPALLADEETQYLKFEVLQVE